MHARSRRGTRWLAAGAGLAAAAAMALVSAPAHADSGRTVEAQLSLSGVATAADVLGGTTVGVHPGDTVDFRAAAVPSAGLNSVPALGRLRPVLDALDGQFQVVVRFGDELARLAGQPTVTLGGPAKGACRGRPDLPVTFADTGSYSFSWSVRYVLPGLFGCQRHGLNSTDLNQLRQAGIAIDADNHWVGRVVVQRTPPRGGISAQLPGVNAAPSLPVVGTLPDVSLPPASLPTLPVSVPSLSDLPVPGTGGGSPATEHDKNTGTEGKSRSADPTWTPPQLSIPEQVVPSGYGSGAGAGPASSAGPSAGAGARPSGPDRPSAGVAAAATHHAGAPSPERTVPAPAPVLLSAQTTSGHGQPMPVLLAIVSIIALALVTALYARMYLLRKK